MADRKGFRRILTVGMSDPTKPTAELLGPVLFVRRTFTPMGLLLWAVSAFGGLISLAALAGEDGRIAGVVVLALAAGAGFLAFRNSIERLRVHERGISQESGGSVRSISDEDVAAMTWNSVREFVNGIYRQTHLTLAFTPVTGKEIRQRISFRGEDPELDELRDRLAEAVADRMQRDFERGQPVPWTRSLRFLPEGLWYVPRGLLFRKEPKVAPFSAIAGLDFQNGRLRIQFRSLEDRVEESPSEPNFFPGFLLLRRMLARMGAS